MPLYILLRKVNESDEFARYEFGPAEESLGSIRIDKGTGKVTVLKDVAGDTSRSYSIRAMKILQEYHRRGEYPEDAGSA